MRLTPNNYTASRERLQKVIAFCRKTEYDVPSDYEAELFANLKAEFEKVLRADHAKQEQEQGKMQEINPQEIAEGTIRIYSQTPIFAHKFYHQATNPNGEACPQRYDGPTSIDPLIKESE